MDICCCFIIVNQLLHSNIIYEGGLKTVGTAVAPLLFFRNWEKNEGRAVTKQFDLKKFMGTLHQR